MESLISVTLDLKKNEITWDGLIRLLSNELHTSCDHCQKTSFKGWESFTKEMESKLQLLGDFKDSETYISKNGYNEYHPNGTNYWSKDAPIALAFCPYHESQIRTCESCKAVFLTYTECSGHAPQNRCRWVQSSLIDFKD